jgi:hypothetical protein
VNLHLPFDQVPPDDLDAFLAEIDRELDQLFLDDVAGSLERIAAEPAAAAEAAA